MFCQEAAKQCSHCKNNHFLEIQSSFWLTAADQRQGIGSCRLELEKANLGSGGQRMLPQTGCLKLKVKTPCHTLKNLTRNIVSGWPFCHIYETAQVCKVSDSRFWLKSKFTIWDILWIINFMENILVWYKIEFGLENRTYKINKNLQCKYGQNYENQT